MHVCCLNISDEDTEEDSGSSEVISLIKPHGQVLTGTEDSCYMHVFDVLK